MRCQATSYCLSAAKSLTYVTGEAIDIFQQLLTAAKTSLGLQQLNSSLLDKILEAVVNIEERLAESQVRKSYALPIRPDQQSFKPFAAVSHINKQLLADHCPTRLLRPLLGAAKMQLPIILLD